MPLPPDDLGRQSVVARPNEDSTLPRVGVVGDTYTILLSGKDTAGRYCLVDMYVPPGGGPPLHRHDFEESFTVLEGQIEATFRGKSAIVKTGETVSIPANAPHQFRNNSDKPARLLCVCSPAGQDEFFLAVGVPVADRKAPPPVPDAASMAALKEKMASLLPKYKTEMIERA